MYCIVLHDNSSCIHIIHVHIRTCASMLFFLIPMCSPAHCTFCSMTPLLAAIVTMNRATGGMETNTRTIISIEMQYYMYIQLHVQLIKIEIHFTHNYNTATLVITFVVSESP